MAYQIRVNITYVLYGSNQYTIDYYGESENTWGFVRLNLESAPVRTGYTFTGWSFEGSTYGGGAQVDVYGTTGSGQSYTATAQWQENPPTPTTHYVTIHFDPNGGTPSTYADVTGSYTDPDTSVELTMPPAPTKEGYTFTGWSGYAAGRSYYFSEGTYSLVADWVVLPDTGKVVIKTDTGWRSHSAYIFTGSAWQRADAYVFNGTNWEKCNG